MHFHARSRARTRFIPALLLLSATLCCPAGAEILPVTPQQAQRLGINTAPVRPAATRPLVSVLGRVTPAPGARTPVSAPFAGTLRALVRLEARPQFPRPPSARHPHGERPLRKAALWLSEIRSKMAAALSISVTV